MITQSIRRGFAAFCIAGLLMTGASGCGPSKEAKNLRLAGIEALEKSDYTAAIEKLNAALEKGKDGGKEFHTDTMQYIAEAQYRAGSFADAASTLGDLVSLEGKRAEFWYLKASAEAKCADYEKALTSLTTGCKNDKNLPKLTTPGAAEAIVFTAQALAEGGETDAAMKLCDQYMEKAKDENARNLRVTKGFIYEKQGEWGNAAECFEQVLNEFGEDEAIRKEFYFAQSRQTESEG